ncbi:MAG: hypothetical protein COB98_07185, partial [Flavobacteriaceae bacterium]
VDYKICENGADPVNCDTAKVKITVVNPIAAVDDNYSDSPITGGDSTPDITDNDTLDGSPVVIGTNPGEITLTGISVPSGLTLNPDGTITVAVGTPSGSYEIDYKICENGADPVNCDTAKVKITVSNPIEAVDDDYSDSPITGGDSTPDITDNDTLDGSPVVIGTNSGEITLTGISVPSGLTLNPDGTITVAVGTPSGSYEVDYKICENGADPANCDTAKVKITVANPIDAVDDDYSDSPITGGDSTPDITDNDTLGGSPVVIGTNPGEITLTGINVPSGLTLNPDGTITVAEGTPSGSYEVDYKICENGADLVNCDTAKVKIVVLNKGLDTDGDGVLDTVEIAKGTDPNQPCSYNVEDITESITSKMDCDGDGVLDAMEVLKGTDTNDPCDFIGADITKNITVQTDCDKDGITTMDEDLDNNGNPDDDDTDNDGIPNYLDADDDNDGLSTAEETQEGDCDEDGVLDYLDPDSCEIIVHNLVSPNGDGKNDYLYITGIQSHPENTLEIYNRWGVLVYETKDYGSKNNVFRGVSEGRMTMEVSKELPVGTYYYILVYTHNTTAKVVKKAGYLYINR